MFLIAYNLAWAMALPFLACSSRLREGWKERLSLSGPLPRADLWIQASSAGEAYLASQLAEKLTQETQLRVFVTCSTTQGLQIYKNFLSKIQWEQQRGNRGSGYFPFDMPLIVRRALDAVAARVLILLETELWPGLFSQCRRRGTPIVILNGRLSEKSLRRHLRLSRFWLKSAPDRVLAISEQDAVRFRRLFPDTSVGLMKNMKFDRISFETASGNQIGVPGRYAGNRSPVVVLGSVRKEEEQDIQQVIAGLLSKAPKVTIALFPRHMHRVGSWLKSLNRAGIDYVLRSEINDFIQPGKVILWNVFGELSRIYKIASAAFVGGTLRPCGGQNFLEPLGAGLVPCIGPYWDNFAWVGREIVELGLVREVKNAQELVEGLVRSIHDTMAKDEVIALAVEYVRQRQGGTEQACQEILRWLA